MWIWARWTGRGLASGQDTIVVPIQPAGTRNAIFLVPGGHTDSDLALADAQFFWYIRLIRALGGDRPVLGLRTLGLRGTLKSYRSIEHLATGYADAVLLCQPHGPHLLVGDCVGGILAYEIARQLSFRSSRVALVLLDTHYPDRSYKQYLMANFPDLWQEWGGVPALALMANSPDVKQVRGCVPAVARALKQTWNQQRAINSSILKMSKYMIRKVPSLPHRVHLFREKMQLSALILNYEPRPFNGRLSILLTEREFEAGLAHAWENVAINGLVTHRIPGGHGSYLRESVGIVSNIVREIAESNEASPHTQSR